MFSYFGRAIGIKTLSVAIVLFINLFITIQGKV